MTVLRLGHEALDSLVVTSQPRVRRLVIVGVRGDAW